MALDWDPVYLANLALCIVIFFLGYWGYKRRRDVVPILIGLAFGLFGISHIMTILGLTTELASMLIAIRTFAYLLVVLALYRYVKTKTDRS